MAAVKISRLRPLCSSAKANRGIHIKPCVAYTSKSYHTRESGHVQNLESHSSRILFSNSANYAWCSRGGYFDACYTNKLLGSSVFRGSFSFVGISPFVSNRLFSSSTEGKGSITRDSNVIADSDASGSGVTDGGVGQDGWIGKANDIWQSAGEAIKYSGEKAKEVSDEAASHVQKIFDTYPYLRDVIVPVGGTLVGTLLAWSLLPSILRRFHRYSMQNPVALLARSSLWGSVPYEKSFWSAMEDPVRYFITFLAFLQIGEMVAPTVISSEYIVPAWRGAFIVSLVWFLHRWKTNVITRALAAKSVEHVDRDKLLTLDKISSVGLLVVGLMALAEACGVAVQSVMTVGGIGGVATAFASRDILGNVLSGLSVQISRPFSIGDTIKAGSVEGQVVDMGLTTTSLLTAEKFPVIVPNSLFSSQVIVNKSRAKWRTMSTKIPLQIDDIDKISQISEDIKSMLRSNSNVFLEKEAPYCFLSCIERSYGVLTFGCNLKNVEMARIRITARKSVTTPVLDKDEIIKNPQASLVQEREDNAELVRDLNNLLATKHDLEEQREHLQSDVQKFSRYYDKAEQELNATKELLAAAQAEIAELKAQREQICFTAVQRHNQDAATIQELQMSVHNLTLHQEHLVDEVHQLEEVLINVQLEIEPIVGPMEDEAMGDGEIVDD